MEDGIYGATHTSLQITSHPVTSHTRPSKSLDNKKEGLGTLGRVPLCQRAGVHDGNLYYSHAKPHSLDGAPPSTSSQ